VPDVLASVWISFRQCTISPARTWWRFALGAEQFSSITKWWRQKPRFDQEGTAVLGEDLA
jgi:hypothetical protein